jgi:AcrR family transcriptional regulator
MRIVNDGGLEALTMQRMADDLDAAVGTIYTYFPSKVSLLAELQRESTDRLIASYTLLRERVDPAIAERTDDERVATLTTLLLTLRFWVATDEAYPEESSLFRSLITWQGEMPDDDLARVVPSAWALFALGATTVQAATDAGALSEGSAPDRMVTAAAALGGVMLMSTLGKFEQTLFDGRRLASQLVHDLVAGWGADSGQHEAAARLVDELAAEGPLAPPVESETSGEAA